MDTSFGSVGELTVKFSGPRGAGRAPDLMAGDLHTGQDR
jgi:hypothetical protein